MFETYKDFVHGGILVLVLIFLPQGLVTGLIETVRIRLALRRSKDAAA
jgi:branched-chain amino acid transport system permease protein